MADAHITVIAVAPSEPAKLDVSAAAANDAAAAGDKPFAAVLGERVGALLGVPADAARGEVPAEPHDGAPDKSADAAADLANPPLVLASLPPLNEAARLTAKAPSKDAAQDESIQSPRLPQFANDLRERPAPALRAQDANIEFDVAKLMAEPARPRVAEPLPQQPHAESPSAAAPSATLAAAAAIQLNAPAAATPSAAVAVPVHAPEWRDAVSERIAVFVRDKVHAAELHVNPPELGPISVRVDVNGSEANVVFGVQHAETRNLLTEALPRLQELLAASGIALTGAQVGAEFKPQRDGAEAQGATDRREPQPADAAVRTVVLRGLVDVFA